MVGLSAVAHRIVYSKTDQNKDSTLTVTALCTWSAFLGLIFFRLVVSFGTGNAASFTCYSLPLIYFTVLKETMYIIHSNTFKRMTK